MLSLCIRARCSQSASACAASLASSPRDEEACLSLGSLASWSGIVAVVVENISIEPNEAILLGILESQRAIYEHQE